MNTRLPVWTVAGLLLAAGSAPMLAQEPAAGGGAENRATKAERPAGNTGAKTTAVARDTVGLPVRTADGKDLGRVEDVAVDEVAGHSYAMLTLSSGERVAVPFAVIQKGVRGKAVVLDAARLERAPRLQGGTDWRAHIPNGWSEDAERYWTEHAQATDPAKKGRSSDGSRAAASTAEEHKPAPR